MKKSNCCGAELYVEQGIEGTNYYICTKCKKACDPAIKDEKACEHDSGDFWMVLDLSNENNQHGISFRKDANPSCPFCKLPVPSEGAEEKERGDLKAVNLVKDFSSKTGLPSLSESEGDFMAKAEEIKENFIKTMKWGEPGNYDQEDVKTIVLGNLNTITYRFAEAIKDAVRVEREKVSAIIRSAKFQCAQTCDEHYKRRGLHSPNCFYADYIEGNYGEKSNG